MIRSRWVSKDTRDTDVKQATTCTSSLNASEGSHGQLSSLSWTPSFANFSRSAAIFTCTSVRLYMLTTIVILLMMSKSSIVFLVLLPHCEKWCNNQPFHYQEVPLSELWPCLLMSSQLASNSVDSHIKLPIRHSVLRARFAYVRFL